jgi:stalled ribosome rescue protein Dom34
MALETKVFELRVDRCEDLYILPWNLDDYDVYFQKTKRYCVDNEKRPFDGSSRSSFLSSLVDFTLMSLNLRKLT